MLKSGVELFAFKHIEPYRVCRRLSILRECSDDQIKI
ncbi:helix-turn-helix domain-containing protein, partial [Acinetobacter baumannii]|nr:helix-turn-helix domain-containing protein [Acinetobacter baumannii]